MNEGLVVEFKKLEKEVNEALDNRRKLAAQLTENIFVKDELSSQACTSPWSHAG